MTTQTQQKLSQQSIQWHLQDKGLKFLVKFFDKDGNLVYESINHCGNIHYARGGARWTMTLPPNSHYHSFTVKRIGKKELLTYFTDELQDLFRN